MLEKLRKMLIDAGIDPTVGSMDYWQNELEGVLLDMYEEGQTMERELNAKLCEQVGDSAKDNDGYTIGVYACAKAIRQGVWNER